MTKHVVSARGVIVDFDLLGIKKAMAELPITENVKKRERFINKKRRRGVKRRVDEMAQKAKLEGDAAAAIAEEMEDSQDSDESEDSDDATTSTTPKRRRKVGK